VTGTLERANVERFRAAVAERLGLQFEDGKLDHLAEVLRQRIEESGCDGFASYLCCLLSPATGHEELRALARRLTVAETYFFRNPDQFRALADLVLPDRARAAWPGRPLRILSAGCASGEEAYSLAILVREHLPELPCSGVKIHGIDVNTAMIDKAVRARYSTWSLRDTPADLRDRYFRADGRELALDDAVRTMASFEARNLVEDDPVFWQQDAFDVVFCRNVTMYFSPEVTRRVIARIARALTPGGFLFLGHAETLRGISQEFHLRHTHGTFYYQRRDAAEPRALPAAFDVVLPDLPSTAPIPATPEPADSWVETIHRASERIAMLAPDRGGRRGANAAGATPADDRSRSDIGLAVELLREERFADALELLRALPLEARADRDAQLLHAALLTNAGDVCEAEQVCKALLALDELNAGAHYLMALCREHAGDRRAAVEHDQAAVYLDPCFAMPHLHLGLLAKRAGDLEAARHELGQVLMLLGREDASRILLFGGGFGREALAALCRAELRACGADS
jgi:chemotaxis protein methyltransferase CheR